MKGVKDHYPTGRAGVSVIMPVYNGESFLLEAAESILAQKKVNLELIIIDDGSTDSTGEIIDFLTQKDSRISAYKHTENAGIVSCLNWGIQQAQYEYIARMDSDDISLPDRLCAQQSFLDQNPTVGVVGTAVQRFGEISPRVVRYPKNDKCIKAHLVFRSPFCHPSVMFRRSLITGIDAYAEEAVSIEDYDLWIRLASHTKFANLPTPYLRYRMHASSITSQTSNQLQIKRRRLLLSLENWLKLDEHSISNILDVYHLCLGSEKLSVSRVRELWGLENKKVFEKIGCCQYCLKIAFYEFLLSAGYRRVQSNQFCLGDIFRVGFPPNFRTAVKWLSLLREYVLRQIVN